MAGTDMIGTALFYFFSLLTLAGAILTVTLRNVVLNGVWLIISLLGVAGLFLLQGAEFLFVSQLILYIGGIVLLFLFAIMLVNLEAATKVERFRRGWPLVLAAAVGLATELVALLTRGTLPHSASSGPSTVPNTEALADVLFSRYLVAFELASIVLLTAIVGAVWMGQRREEDSL
jgi:NADH-quinone oxidoreductase subunit J